MSQASSAVSAYLTGEVSEVDANSSGSSARRSARKSALEDVLLELAKRADEEGESELSAGLVDLIAKHR